MSSQLLTPELQYLYTLYAASIYPRRRIYMCCQQAIQCEGCEGAICLDIFFKVHPKIFVHSNLTIGEDCELPKRNLSVFINYSAVPAAFILSEITSNIWKSSSLVSARSMAIRVSRKFGIPLNNGLEAKWRLT